MNSSQLQPGQELSIRGTLQVVDSQIQAGSRIRVRPYLGIERVTGPDGTAISAFNMLFSTVLTPTGLPMENTFGGSGGETPNSAGVNPQASPSVELQVQAGSATGNIELSLKLPADFLAGYYLPFVSFAFDGVQFGPSVQDRTAVGSHFGRLRNLAGEQNAMYLPVVRLGDPPPPRMFWSLLVDTLNNGTRGGRAVEDRSRFGIAPRIATDSDTFIVPRTNPATGAPYKYRLEPFVLHQAIGSSNVAANPPKIPLKFPSGSLTVRIQKPDGSIQTIGPAPFAQARTKMPIGRNGELLDNGGGHITHAYELSTMDPRYEITLAQDGLHRITLEGSVEDIWKNVWSGGGTYEIYVARLLSLDTAVLPGTAFEAGDVFTLPWSSHLRYPPQWKLAFSTFPSRIRNVPGPALFVVWRTVLDISVRLTPGLSSMIQASTAPISWLPSRTRREICGWVPAPGVVWSLQRLRGSWLTDGGASTAVRVRTIKGRSGFSEHKPEFPRVRVTPFFRLIPVTSRGCRNRTPPTRS
jgi:hypothetical protein